ncbi:hypothetical protein I926_07850 [Pasteurella multocida subsp. multocida OH4807]|nr:hypothetical protein I926_07850 [Pasteurella multocida subsp. multocida OH4807]
MSDSQKYENNYSDSGFWDKLTSYAKVAGQSVIEPALKMYYAAQDEDTPLWAKTIIYGALGYFILPVDAIPDIIPGAGYADDLGALAAALGTVAMHIKDEHVQKAKEKIKQWFN